MSKNQLYSKFFAGIGYLGDYLGLDSKGKSLLKDKVVKHIKWMLDVDSLTELSYEEMESLVEIFYDFFPLEFSSKEKKGSVSDIIIKEWIDKIN